MHLCDALPAAPLGLVSLVATKNMYKLACRRRPNSYGQPQWRHLMDSSRRSGARVVLIAKK